MKRFCLLSTILAVFCSCSHKPGTGSSDMPRTTDTVVIMEGLLQENLPEKVIIEKDFLYDRYTLEDVYPYRDTVRKFQWDKIQQQLELLESVQKEPARWAVIQNRKNVNGVAPLARNVKRNAYKNLEDPYGVQRYESIPLYFPDDLTTPERYGNDGSLVKIIGKEDSSVFLKTEAIYIGGEWMIPEKYIKYIADSIVNFKKAIFVDRTNQNIATLEKVGLKWLVRSMNPATTGLHKPPFMHETPLGIFVIQEKKEKMFFLIDGTSEIAGFAPYASRFSNGGYLHGIPVNYPRKTFIEFGSTLGTTPRSHMCVRNATSHAKFMFDWAPVEQSLVFVFD